MSYIIDVRGPHGLGNIARVTAAEFRHMMKQLVFVIDGLILAVHKSNINENEAKRQDKQLVDLYVTWNKMYLLSRQEVFSHSELNEFQVIILIFIYHNFIYL